MSQATSPAPRRHGSVAITRGVRVAVTPSFLEEHSDPDARRFLFAYRIRITNEGQEPVQLLSRHWIIVNAHGETDEVRGDGVVGQHPHLPPGEHFEYASYCPLNTRWGTMEGEYTLRTDSGEEFQATIARFYLVTPDKATE